MIGHACVECLKGRPEKYGGRFRLALFSDTVKTTGNREGRGAFPHVLYIDMSAGKSFLYLTKGGCTRAVPCRIGFPIIFLDNRLMIAYISDEF